MKLLEEAMGIIETAEEFAEATPRQICESSLSRLLQHVQESDRKSWTIIKSWRQEKSHRENKKRFQKLKQDVKSLGLGYVQLVGKGQEEGPEGELVSVEEPSLFVIGIDRDDAEALMRKYDQWGIVYAGPDTNGKILMLKSSGSPDVIGRGDPDSFRPMMVAKYYSELKGKPFVLGPGKGAGGGNLRKGRNESRDIWESENPPFWFERVPGFMEGWGRSLTG